MKKSKRRSAVAAVPSINQPEEKVIEPQEHKRFWSGWSTGERIGTIAVCLCLSLASFGAGLKYLEDSARQQELNAKNASNKENAGLLNSINPFIEPPSPTPTPQLSKEYVYAGSKLLAVEDANASAAPPADLAVWRPSSGYWYVLGGQSVQWGGIINGTSDIPVPGDYDGDGKTDFSVFRPTTGNWYIVRSSDGSNFAYSFGQAGDKEAPADYDGDGKTDAAIVRPNYPTTGSATWFIQFSSTGTYAGYEFANSSDKPTPADFDGDGRADLAVWRDSSASFYYSKSSTNFTSAAQAIACGATGDTPVVADYDGDGKADAAVRTSNSSNWVIKQSSDNTTNTIAWQLSTDKEVPNDYDGDGKVDIAVWRESIGYWLIRQSSQLSVNNGLRQVQWGGVGDIPVPAFYRR